MSTENYLHPTPKKQLESRVVLESFGALGNREYAVDLTGYLFELDENNCIKREQNGDFIKTDNIIKITEDIQLNTTDLVVFIADKNGIILLNDANCPVLFEGKSNNLIVLSIYDRISLDKNGNFNQANFINDIKTGNILSAESIDLDELTMLAKEKQSQNFYEKGYGEC
jgi:hypothetical protein